MAASASAIRSRNQAKVRTASKVRGAERPRQPAAALQRANSARQRGTTLAS